MVFFFSVIFLLASNSEAANSSYAQELINRAHELKLSDEEQWINLGHYKGTLFGNKKSQVAGAGFFLSPEGKSNPSGELDATLLAFFSREIRKDERDEPQCQFPARFKWLNEKLHFDFTKMPKLECKRFLKFHDSVAAKSATVVFTSYFLNNPSSAFGHSFLRLNKSDSLKIGERYELLDYGVNYAAEVDTSNPVFYAFKGLMGLFKGTFTNIPFYYKVREYNDFESRDLWGYDLNLTPDQIEMLVAHIWELGSTYFDYWYLSQNCSYHILSIIDVANPTLHLADHLPHFFVIPIETIKVMVDSPGLVKNVQYRPAIRSQFDARLKKLNSDEKRLLKKIVLNENDTPDMSQLSPEKKARVYDAAIDYIDFQHAEEILKEEGTPASKWKQRLLLTRSKLGVPSEDLDVEPSGLEIPHTSHSSIRAGLAYGSSDSLGHYALLDWRFALHDLLDPQSGYPEYAQIEFMHFKIRQNIERAQTWLDELMVFNVTTLSEFTSLHKQLSWRFKIGQGRIRDSGCDQCGAGIMDGGMGIAFKPFESFPFSVFSMAEGEFDYSSSFAHSSMRLGIGPAAGLRARFGENFISMLQGNYRFFLGRDTLGYKYSWISRYAFSQIFALNLELLKFPDATEGHLGFFFYF